MNVELGLRPHSSFFVSIFRLSLQALGWGVLYKGVLTRKDVFTKND